jgi:protein-tyrosine-phosphatase
MKTLFVCKHNLGRSQIACALYNYLTDTNDAISAGTSIGMYPEKTLGEFSEETRAMKVMREIGLDLTNAPRQQLVPELARNANQIISFVLPEELPQWLQNDKRLKIWHLKYYPALDIEAVRRQRDEIKTHVKRLINDTI